MASDSQARLVNRREVTAVGSGDQASLSLFVCVKETRHTEVTSTNARLLVSS